MRYFGAESKRVSPYMNEITNAQCVRRLANLVGLLQITSGDDFDFDSREMRSLLADVEAVGQEYGASPDDMQTALQTNDRQLIKGATIVYGET